MLILPGPNGNLPVCPGLPVERLHGGEPIIAPTAHWWESGVTFNTATVYLPRSAAHDPLIARLLETDELDDPKLRDGIVAAHYRARPLHDPGFRFTRSFTGLACFTPDTRHLLARRAAPLISPSVRATDDDGLGVEDPRVTQIGDAYYAVYCGVQDVPEAHGWKANLCAARSADLLHWEKLGALRGDINCTNNKDGVYFPKAIDGQYLFLHRPMRGPMREWAIHLATSDAPDGVWRDCGEVLRAHPNPALRTSWVGAGSVPIPLGARRYLVIFHTGHFHRDGRREYDLDAAILNFARFDPSHPERLLDARLDRIMVPETETEVNGPFPDSVANVLFTCGTYVYRDDLYILYGGGDTYVMSARLKLAALLDRLEGAKARELVSA
ncbi:MAG TPA: hypothetical protein PLZ36_01160 [Armatimonadota bacterium]|nr:hypothetical protein [Armatimonadota bacterium]HOS43205.1 hypothetical protein [Armatimonadota bacterium]